MVEDEKIEAKKSPFALREGEIKTFDGKDRLCFNESNSTEDEPRTYKRLTLCQTRPTNKVKNPYKILLYIRRRKRNIQNILPRKNGEILVKLKRHRMQMATIR